MEIPHSQQSARDKSVVSPAQTERLWTPWRMEYIGGESGEAGCVFCNRLAGSDDVRSLILHRGEEAFVVMNLFPYNTGHVMIVPNAHVASPEVAAPTSLAAVARLQVPVLRAIRRALGCDGFNLGSNVGEVAGAGIASHMHLHVVPRWTGDANFMPILASVKVLPELIPVTYAKLRAELARELAPAVPHVTAVVLTHDLSQVFVTRDADGQPGLPKTVPDDDEPCWRAALRRVGKLNSRVRLIGWAGPSSTVATTTIALTYHLRDAAPSSDVAEFTLYPVDQIQAALTDAPDRAAVADALANLVPAAGAQTSP